MTDSNPTSKPVVSMPITLVGDLSQPLVKALELIGKATGAIWEPTGIRRRASAEADALQTRTLAEIDAEALKIRATQREANKEVRRQKNIEDIRDKAFAELKSGPTPTPSESPDEDWVEQFFDKCQDIGNVKMQVLWSRLLAGEIRRPGSFAPTTLEVVKRLTPTLANIFRNAVQRRCEIKFPTDGPPVFFPVQPIKVASGPRLGTREWIFMEDAGLVKIHKGGDHYYLRTGTYGVKYGTQECRLIAKQRISVSVGTFTAAGEEIATLCESTFDPFIWNEIVVAWGKEGGVIEQIEKVQSAN